MPWPTSRRHEFVDGWRAHRSDRSTRHRSFARARVVTYRPPAEAMGPLVRETFRAMIEGIEHEFKNSDLIMSQWLALRLLQDGKIRCIGDVDRELGLEGGSSTRLVDQLEKRGLLIRHRSTIDRRVVGIMLTMEGTATIDAMRPTVVRFWRDQLIGFTDAEQTALFGLLSRLRSALTATAATRMGEKREC